MKLAIAIFRYFPYGGLQRDMRFIAEEAIKRGHQVTIFCGDWQGEKISGADIRVIDTFVWFNIAGVRRFVKAFEKQFNRNEFDLLLGFNKMPGLDAYFAGDTCFAEKVYKKRNWLYRLTPRARLYLQYENAVFSQQSKTRIFSLVDSEKEKFVQHYAIPENRFCSLPPGIVAEHIVCSDVQIVRRNLLSQLSQPDDIKIIICLGSDFRRKGVDLSISVFSKLQENSPNSVLLVVGKDEAQSYQQQATVLGVAHKVFFMGASDHVGDLLHAADAMLHLAREELAGNVILEAILSNCPVLVSSVSGYAPYVARTGMGLVIESITNAETIAQQLAQILSVDKSFWIEKSRQFYLSGEAFSRIPVMMNCLEEFKENCQNKKQQIAIEDWRDLQVNGCNQAVFSFISQIQGDIVRKMPDRETLRFDLGGRRYYLKRHFGVGWKEIVKNLIQFRLPVLGAINEWRALRMLSAVGVPSLQPVTFGERGRNPARQVSFIVTDELENVIQLDHYLEQYSPRIPQKVALIQKVAAITRGMHQAGINHRDFYLCHFMLKKDWLAGQPELYIIDLHRAQLRSKVPERWLIKDLAALYFSSMSLPVSSKDRLRFLRIYFQKSLHEIFEQERSLLSKVILKAKRLYKKHSASHL